MQNMHEELQSVITNWMLEDGANPMSVAAVMMTTALRIYRTSLSDDDYNKMMDYLSEVRNNIEKYPTPDEYKNLLN